MKVIAFSRKIVSSLSFSLLFVVSTQLNAQCYIDAVCAMDIALKDRVVMIWHERGTCSGTLIKSKLPQYQGNTALILTADHCISSLSERPEIYFNYASDFCGADRSTEGFSLGRASVLAKGNGGFKDDWALLSITNNLLEDYNIQRADINTNKPGSGTSIMVFHHANGLRKGYADGFVKRVDSKNVMELEMTFGKVTSGASGAGVFDFNADLIGVYSNVANSSFNDWSEEYCPNYSSTVGNIGIGPSMAAIYPHISQYIEPSTPSGGNGSTGSSSDSSSGGTFSSWLIYLLLVSLSVRLITAKSKRSL